MGSDVNVPKAPEPDINLHPMDGVGAYEAWKDGWQKGWCAATLPVSMPPDTLIKVGMLADVEGYGPGVTISEISVTLCPRQDPKAEGSGEFVEGTAGDPPTAVDVVQIEAALLPYAVIDFSGHWAYGHQVRRVYEKDGSGRGA